ncbi:MAG: CvpA family protein [Thermovirga sp.]|nr:CvpA family protein [Thermovirga sp.]
MGLAFTVDLIVLFMAIYFVSRGLLRGLSGEIISILSVVGGFLLAWYWSDKAAELLVSWFALEAGYARILCLFLIYLLCLIAGGFLRRVVKAFLRFVSLSVVDRFLGGIAGLLKSLVFLLLIYMATSFLVPFMGTDWVKKSVSMNIAGVVLPYVQDLMGKIDSKEFNSFPLYKELWQHDGTLPLKVPVGDINNQVHQEGDDIKQ